jgi:integrase
MLTDRQLRNIKPRATDYELRDGAVPGLALRVRSTGAAAWVLRYEIAGRPRRMTLGRFPAKSLAAVRKEALGLREQIEAGADPGQERQRAQADTVAAVADLWVKRYVYEHRKRPEDVDGAVRKHIVEPLGHVPIGSLTRKQIVQAADPLVLKGNHRTAQLMLSLTRQMLAWAVERGLRDDNPAAGISKRALGIRTETRDRALTLDEIAVWWPALDVHAPGWVAAACRVLLLTGARQGELRAARWEHVQLEGKAPQWHMPETKNGTAHTVPLSPLAVQQFKALKKLAGESEWVLPGVDPDGPITDRSLTRAITRTRHAWDESIEEEGKRFAHWSAHDLRRTCATICAASGTPPHVVQAILNHKGELGVTGVYLRYDWLPEMRTALDRFAQEVTRAARLQA